jgi:hypothetical protein
MDSLLDLVLAAVDVIFGCALLLGFASFASVMLEARARGLRAIKHWSMVWDGANQRPRTIWVSIIALRAGLVVLASALWLASLWYGFPASSESVGLLLCGVALDRLAHAALGRAAYLVIHMHMHHKQTIAGFEERLTAESSALRNPESK